jgi:hypothetical protein
MGKVSQVVVCAFLLSAVIAEADCVSKIQDTSSGVINRIGPAIAWSGTNVGIAKTDIAAADAISFGLYSEDLAALTGDRAIAPTSFDGPDALLWNGTDFGLFYRNRSATQIQLRRISASGQPSSASVPVAATHSLSGDAEYDVIWDPTRQAYLMGLNVPTGIDKGLWFIIMNTDGTTRLEQQVSTVVGRPASPHLAVNAHGVVAFAFARPEAILVQLIDATNTGGVIQPFLTAHDVRIASDGVNFIGIGSAPVTGIAKQLDWTLIDERGIVGVRQSRLVTARGAEIAPVSVMWNPTMKEWALAYLDSLYGFSEIPGDYRLKRFTVSGATISDSMFSPDALISSFSTTEPFVWTGTSYISAAVRRNSAASYAIRVCPLRASIATASPSVQPTKPVTFMAVVEGGSQSHLTYEWDLGDFKTTKTGQTISHAYTQFGVYTVTLRVTDAVGSTTVTTYQVHVVQSKRRAVGR